ncbi:hypothetical protein SAMN05216258_104544 [Albimonas pacifica]|uniref:Uncharacterized protein n=1 Tax=Albimonas pacifica TaxID=1114924 RepID=A0A1I3FVV3_9RHOB|nr:hypothetical protein SAMN05216258_104544 [Albimonas pacifica]
MPDPHDDRFGCAWGSATNGRSDPQPLARIALGQAAAPKPNPWKQPCKRRTHRSNRLPLRPSPWRWVFVAGVAFWIAVAALIAWGIWG